MLEKLEGLLRHKKSKSYYAERLGITVEEVEELMEEIREPADKREYKHNTEVGTIEVSSIYKTPPTPEQVERDHKIDRKSWKLINFYSKGRTKGWLVTAQFREIEQEAKDLTNFQKFLEDYTPTKKVKVEEPLEMRTQEPSCMVISLCDFHLDKQDTDMVQIEDRVEEYKNTIFKLVNRASKIHNLEEIVYVIGNDFFQTDTISGTTVKGTPVSTNTTWDNAYELGFQVLEESIRILKSYCQKLKVVLVLGNHSASKEYYLAHALEKYFYQVEGIEFDRTSHKYKCHVYGETALFFNHGDNINDKLPLMFAQTFKKEFGSTRYSEILLGDKHHSKERRFSNTLGEAQGIRMRILPALTGTDQWHYDNIYTNSIQAGVAIIYDKEKGKITELEHRI